jgi:radical SAM superfamily enzyme YgiQ (UPF0313 family)
MVKISFIVPTWQYFSNPFKLQPLLELYFSTIIREEFSSDSILIDIIDLRDYRKQKLDDDNLDYDVFCDSIIPQRDIYFYWSPKTADFYEVERVVKLLRDKYPESKHVAGGTHVDNFIEECSLIFDAVVNGPGDRSFSRYIDDYINGLTSKVYKDDWKDVHYKDFPFPKRDFLPLSSIVNRELFTEYGGLLGTSVLFSRGCPFQCKFCVYNIPNRLQTKTPGDIKAEINYLKDNYHVEAINVRDEMCIGMSEKIYIPFLHAIGDSDVVWRGQTRVGINNNLISLAKDSGCVELVLGVESVCQNVLDGINKNQTIEQSIDTIRYCKEVDIKTRINLILGLPGEPLDIVDRTIKFFEDYKPNYVSISGLCPVPGSDIFKNPKKYGIKYIDRDWSKHSHLMFRYGEDEEGGLPFEYDDIENSFSRKEIIANIKVLQEYLRQNNMSY